MDQTPNVAEGTGDAVVTMTKDTSGIVMGGQIRRRAAWSLIAGPLAPTGGLHRDVVAYWNDILTAATRQGPI